MRNDPLARPVIAVTTNNTFESDAFLASAGVFYRQEKPFTADELDIIIRGALLYWKKKSVGSWKAASKPDRVPHGS